MAKAETLSRPGAGLASKKRKIGDCDFLLVILVTILAVFGVVMVFSASYYYSINTEGTPYTYLFKQGFFAATGFAFMMILSHFDYHKLAYLALPMAAVEVVLLLLLFTPLGVTINGATRWLDFFFFTVMPGELAKPVIIILAAVLFAADMDKVKTVGGLAPVVIYTGLACLLILKQPNLSTAMTVAAIAVGIAFMAGMQWRYILLILIVVGAGAYYIAFIDQGYQHERVMSFLDPFAQAQDNGFQVVQSLLALGTGGFRGVGLGMSVQKNLYLPEPQNDFILAIIGEELGFVGIALMIIVFVLVIWRIFYIALSSRDNLGMLLAGGVAIMIGVQVIFNIAVVTSSMPPTGVALPFISYGGNSIWIIMALIGIVLNVSRQRIDTAGGSK